MFNFTDFSCFEQCLNLANDIDQKKLSRKNWIATIITQQIYTTTSQDKTQQDNEEKFLMQLSKK